MHRLRWTLTHFKVTATRPENTDTLPQSVGVRAKEGQGSLNVPSVEKDIMDSVGHNHPTKIHRKEDGKVIEKEMAREHTEGCKASRRIVESGSWAQWSDQSWQTAGSANWREDDWYTAESSSHESAAAAEFQCASFGELRLSNFLVLPITSNLFSLTGWTRSSEPSYLALIPLHAKLLFLRITPRRAGI